MEDIKLTPKKKTFKDKIYVLFSDRKRRHLLTTLLIIPFLVEIAIFGYVAYKEAKNIISLLTSGQAVIREDHNIASMNYVLRDEETEIQFEYFTELKNAIEKDGASEEIIAGLVCKNFVTDLYTWTNKNGQYDISALYYIYTPQKTTIYTQLRDGLYKYLNTYITKYGKENLLEVESANVVKSKAQGYEYLDSDGIAYSDCYYVTINWTYKANSKFDTSKYPTSCNFVVVENEGRFEIVESSQKEIDARTIETEEETETTEE